MTPSDPLQLLIKAAYDVVVFRAPCDPTFVRPVQPRRIYATLAAGGLSAHPFWEACARRAKVPVPTYAEIEAAIEECRRRYREHENDAEQQQLPGVTA